MPSETGRPLIVQSNHELLLEAEHPMAEAAREALAGFAELVRAPEHVHTYRMTPLTLWNAAAAGLTPAEVLAALGRFSRYPLPASLRAEVFDRMGRYGRVKLVRAEGELRLVSESRALLEEVARHRLTRPYVLADRGEGGLAVHPDRRGHLKMAMTRLGYPVEDLAGYVEGAPLRVALRERTLAGEPLRLRPYQEAAVARFYQEGRTTGGSGVVVLPCGAGKTVVALAAMAAVGAQTLILTSNVTAVRQFIREIRDKTDLAPDLVGEYTGEMKEVRPVTVTTYQLLARREPGRDRFPHLALFNRMDWGLVVYDEVHLLPAPVFRVTAEIQARRRLGLTATLVREDGREEDVFSLIGPKRYELPWRSLERQGHIARATCWEVRVPLPEAERLAYALADERSRCRLAAENPAKLPLVERILALHPGEPALVIGQYLGQLQAISRRLGAPLITGQTPSREREALYARFRTGAERVLVVSKVANFAVDLPDASLLIQVSGAFGSRQEEAQRLGRILRPKADGREAHFYSLVTGETREEGFARNRQTFLTEQGYRYRILRAEELGPAAAPEAIRIVSRESSVARIVGGESSVTRIVSAERSGEG
ncbi:MAG: helicase-associated domain-containing protein [Bacillota bacterium]